jgi:hypothetical protein
VHPERRRARDEERREAAGSLARDVCEKEDRQARRRQRRIGPRLRGVQVDESEAGAEDDPPRARGASRQRPRCREEGEAREERQQAQERIPRGRRRGPREGRLEQVEEGRTRIGPQRREEAGRRQAGRPLRECFVVPERPLEKKEDAGEKTEGDEREETEKANARPALRCGLDALF